MKKSARPPLHYPIDADNETSPFVADAIQQLNKRPWLKLYYAVAALTLLPIRVCLFIASVVPLFLLALISTLGLKGKNPSHPQIVGWRKQLRSVCWFFYRAVLFSYGVLNIKFKGKRMHTKDAPLYVVAPHTSIYFDMAPIYLFGGHPVASAHLLDAPLLGRILRLLDPVFVDRYEAKSRKLAMNVVKERATHAYKYRWKQVLFFPEGLITNGDSMACFKPGAFVPGLPVQPITLKIKRHQSLNLTSWTQTGGQDMLCNFFQFCKPWQEIEVHFMEPYHPNEQEKEDPELYAYNVQARMASHIKIHKTDYSLHDAKVVARAVCHNKFTHQTGMIGVEGISWRHGLRTAYTKETIFDAFVRITNYMYKREESKKFIPIGSGHISPTVTVKDIAYFYGFKGFKFIHETLVKYQREVDKTEVPDWESRKLPINFNASHEMSSRQFAEVFADLVQGTGAAPAIDKALLEKVAQKLEPMINLDYEREDGHQDEDYNMFDEEQAVEIDNLVNRSVGDAFVKYIGGKTLAKARVGEVFQMFCINTADDNEDDHWATDFVAIALKLEQVLTKVPFYYALVKSKEE